MARGGLSSPCSLRSHKGTVLDTTVASRHETGRRRHVLPRWALSQLARTLLSAASLGQPFSSRASSDLSAGSMFDVAARFIHCLGPFAARRTTISRPTTAGASLVRLPVRPLAQGLDRGAAILPSGRRRAVPYAREVLDGAATHAACDQDIYITARPGTLDLKPQVVAPDPPARPLPVHRTDARLILRRLLTEARDRLLVH